MLCEKESTFTQLASFSLNLLSRLGEERWTKLCKQSENRVKRFVS